MTFTCSSLLKNLIRSQVFGIVVTCSNQNQFSESVLLLNVNCCLEVWGWEVKTKLICSAELPAWCHLWLPALFRKPFFYKLWSQGRCLMFHSVCFCFFAGKDHVCRFIGCGRNEKFNYVVMQLQVSSVLLLTPSHWGGITGKVLQWRNKAKHWCRDYAQRRKWVERETVRRGGVAVISLGVPPIVKTC